MSQAYILPLINPQADLAAVGGKGMSLAKLARAIGYRARHNIASQDVSLTVVVQILVFAEAAGILFTANPLTRSREYGIPAMMATDVATRRIYTGQIITVDGNAGTVAWKE